MTNHHAEWRDEQGWKHAIITVPRADWSGRDGGKVFQLNEWPAARAEDWAAKALFAYNRGGGEIPVDQAMTLGMRGIFWLGVNTFLRGQMQAAEVMPIWNELLECVQIVRDPNKRDVSTGKPVPHALSFETDVMEVATRNWLRSEVLRLHTGFSPADVLSKLLSVSTTEGSTTAQTSPE